MPHTPTPWFVDKDNPSVVCGPDDLRICVMRERDEEWDNAAFIVRAANNHDGLVEALKIARAQLRDLPPDGKYHAGQAKIDAAIAAAVEGL